MYNSIEKFIYTGQSKRYGHVIAVFLNNRYNFENIIKISDCVKYRGKSVEIERICNSLPSEFLYYIYEKDVTVDFSDLDNNSELVR